MSTLVAQTISNGTVSTSSANVIQGSAKAWVTFTGAAGTVSASYNVSSVTRTGTGVYTVNFTNAFSDTNYATLVALRGANSAVYGVCMENQDVTKATTSVGVLSIRNDNNASYDANTMYVSFFR
jgi:hypothetical protein